MTRKNGAYGGKPGRARQSQWADLTVFEPGRVRVQDSARIREKLAARRWHYVDTSGHVLCPQGRRYAPRTKQTTRERERVTCVACLEALARWTA